MKEAILVVSFGTSFPEAKKNSLDQIYLDVVKAFPGKRVFEAYTSSIIMKKLAGEGRPVLNVPEALEEILAEGIKKVTVLPTHMIPGIEYKKLQGFVKEFERSFEKITLLPTVLQTEEDCMKMAAIVTSILQIPKIKEEGPSLDATEYILMGHGTEDVANERYHQMNEAFVKLGFYNVRIASVEAKPNLEDAINILQVKYNAPVKIVLHPFMVVAGDHANNDMAGEEDSFKAILEELGNHVTPIVKGLGEYEEFRKEYVEKLR